MGALSTHSSVTIAVHYDVSKSDKGVIDFERRFDQRMWRHSVAIRDANRWRGQLYLSLFKQTPT